MIQRAVPVPDRERVPDRAGHVVLGVYEGVHDRVTPGQVRRHRGRERAAGSVRVRGIDAHEGLTASDKAAIVQIFREAKAAKGTA